MQAGPETDVGRHSRGRDVFQDERAVVMECASVRSSETGWDCEIEK